MTRITSLLIGAGLVALTGCSSSAVSEESAESQAALTCTDTPRPYETCANAKAWGFCGQSWFAGYCDITCGVCSAGTGGASSVAATGGASSVSATGGAAATINYAACETNKGVNPTKAALAVAMGIELGRFEPNIDLVNVNNQYVALTSTAQNRCKVTSSKGIKCPNTQGLLGQMWQDTGTWTSGVFDPSSYRMDLVGGFQYQTGLNNLLSSRHMAGPPDHIATLKGGPINMGTGSCGAHYVFQVDNPDGSALTADQAANMVYWFCYFGMPAPAALGYSCSNNLFVGFFTTQAYGCDAGHYCIAIDPTDGDNGTTASTSAGIAPTYPMNRVYDPNGTLLGTACITTKGVYATLQSKCAYSSLTCGYDYCM